MDWINNFKLQRQGREKVLLGKAQAQFLGMMRQSVCLD